MTNKTIAVLILVVTALLCTPAYAEVDIDYSGPIDSYTGLPTNGKSNVVAKEGYTPVSRGTAYDFALGKYIIYLDDKAASFIHSNIVDEMITADPVSFSGDSLSQAELYRDGILLQSPKLDNITASGGYVLKIKSGANVEGLLMNFTIVPAATSTISAYNMPKGFAITNVTRDGDEIAWSSNYAEMEQEGKYVISYRCNPNKKEYKLAVQIDRTPPELALVGVKDGVATGPVLLNDVEPGAAVHISLEAKTIPFTPELTASGNYMITITDIAQNSTKYQFKMLIYFNGNSYLLFLVILGGIIGLYAYIAVSKKRMRIC